MAADKTTKTAENSQEPEVSTPALTKREFFTAMVLQGMLGNPTMISGRPSNSEERRRLVDAAIQMADVMIDELAQKS